MVKNNGYKIILLGLFISLAPLSARCQGDGPGFFTPVQPTNKLISFADNNTLNLAQGSIKMVRTLTPDGNYSLSITKKGKLIFIKDHIKGFTKILFENGYIMFSVLTKMDKDGSNEGYGYVVNTKDNTAQSFPQKLHNTCNPAMVKETIYFVNNLTIIKTDQYMRVKGDIAVGYAGRDSKPSNVNAILSLSDAFNELQIDFTPNRPTTKSKTYMGMLTDVMDAVMLANEDIKQKRR